MDPMVPASIHSIPQKYNLPSRMWKSAFLLLFERLRHALPASENGRGGQSFGGAEDTHPTGNVTDHLTDFVYYAYTFYTQLLEQQSLSSFRGTWIEQLGDIARYRMTVAEVSGQIPMVGEKATLSDSGHSLKELLEGEDAEETGSPHAKENSLQKTPKKQLVSRKDRKKGFAGMPTKVGQHMEVADTPGNSIGAAALDDWELVEHETWRAVARDWYFLGLSETPGTGRLHHHLALLAEEGDDLRTLYHCCKRYVPVALDAPRRMS